LQRQNCSSVERTPEETPRSAIVSRRTRLALGVDYDWDYIEANQTGSVHVYE